MNNFTDKNFYPWSDRNPFVQTVEETPKHEQADMLPNVRQLTVKEASFLAIALSQKIEVKLTQKMTTDEYNEFKDIIMTAHKRAARRSLHPMLVSAWMSSLTNTRFEPETPHAWTKLEKFVDFLLSVNLKDQLTANEREVLIKALRSTATHHHWLEDKINDIIDRISEDE